MLRSLGLTIVFSLAWISGTTEVALSELPLEPPTIDQSFGGDDLPFCYMQTTNGELMDLTRFCGNGSRRQQTALSPEPPVQTTPAIVIPSAPTGGRGCIVFDEQGRPCISSR